MTNYWVVRADVDIRDSVEAEGFAGIGFGGDQLGDISGFSRDQIRERVVSAHPDSSPSQIGSAVGQLYRFTSVIQECDYVLTPVRDRKVLIGEVTEPYEFVENEPQPHRRKVAWRAIVSRDDLSLSLKNSLGGLMTVFSVKSHADEIAHLLTGEMDVPEPATIEGLDADFETPATDIQYASEVEATARERIADLVLGHLFDGHEFEGVVAALLKAMGFKIVREPQPGADGGVDIIAAPDVFGFEQPRIIVQVKHRRGPASGPEVAQLIGMVTNYHGKGLFVSTGGFTNDARQRAGSDMALLDGEQFVDHFIEYYENLPSEYKAKVPLKRVYLPVPPDEIAT